MRLAVQTVAVLLRASRLRCAVRDLSATIDAYREQVRVLDVQTRTDWRARWRSIRRVQLQSALAQRAEAGRAREIQEHALALYAGSSLGHSAGAQPARGRGGASAAARIAGHSSGPSTRRGGGGAGPDRVECSGWRGDGEPLSDLCLTGAAGFESESSTISRLAERVGLWPPCDCADLPGGRLRANLRQPAEHRQCLRCMSIRC